MINIQQLTQNRIWNVHLIWASAFDDIFRLNSKTWMKLSSLWFNTLYPLGYGIAIIHGSVNACTIIIIHNSWIQCIHLLPYRTHSCPNQIFNALLLYSKCGNVKAIEQPHFNCEKKYCYFFIPLFFCSFDYEMNNLRSSNVINS